MNINDLDGLDVDIFEQEQQQKAKSLFEELKLGADLVNSLKK